jgi:hypothetical protein
VETKKAGIDFWALKVEKGYWKTIGRRIHNTNEKIDDKYTNIKERLIQIKERIKEKVN